MDERSSSVSYMLRLLLNIDSYNENLDAKHEVEAQSQTLRMLTCYCLFVFRNICVNCLISWPHLLEHEIFAWKM